MFINMNNPIPILIKAITNNQLNLLQICKQPENLPIKVRHPLPNQIPIRQLSLNGIVHKIQISLKGEIATVIFVCDGEDVRVTTGAVACCGVLTL